MDHRLTIDKISPTTKGWTSKVQIIEKPRPRQSKDGNTRFQILILQDEKEQKVSAVLYAEAIEQLGEKLQCFCTYLISAAKVRLPLGYGVPVSKYEWVFDDLTIVEPVKEDNTEDLPLPPPTELNCVPFASLYQQPLKSEFDIVAVVVNCGLIKHVGVRNNKCREAILMDTSMQPTIFSMWEDYAEIDGTELAKKIAAFPVIVAKRITRIQYSGSSLSTKFNSVIQIDPPYSRAVQLKDWVRENEETLRTYRQRSSAQTASSPALVSLHHNVTAISDLSVQSPVQLFDVEAGMLVTDADQDFYELLCLNCEHLFRTNIIMKFKCSNCRRETVLTPRACFDVVLTDHTGSVTATLSGPLAESFLDMTATEVYETVYVKKQSLPLDQVRQWHSQSLFQIKLKKLFSRTSELRLSIMSYVQKAGISRLGEPVASMEIAESGNVNMDVATPREELKSDFNATSASPSKRQQTEKK